MDLGLKKKKSNSYLSESSEGSRGDIGVQSTLSNQKLGPLLISASFTYRLIFSMNLLTINSARHYEEDILFLFSLRLS